ncbi:hypothetical protein Tco_0724903, partial [Tanacetum coccineum]
VPEVYMHQFWDSVYKHDTFYRFKMDKRKRFKLNLESSEISSRSALEYRVKTLMHFLLMNKLFSSEEPTKKSKRVKRSAKKSTKAPAGGVVIKETLEMPLSKKKEKVDVARGKGIKLLSDVALTEEAHGSGTVTKTAPSAAKIKPSVTSEGTGVKPGVPDVTEEESSEKNDSDDDKTQSDNENKSDSHHETDESESGSESDHEKNKEDEDDEEEVKDEFVKTSSNDSNDEDEAKITDKLKGTDAAMTNVQQGNGNLEILQVIEDAHVTLSTVPQKTEVPVTSSSHSSNLAAKFLNFSDIPHTNNEIVSAMDVHAHHEKRSRKDKDEDPFAGSDRGLKKRKTSKDVEPAKGPKAIESQSGSSKGDKSQSKSSRKSVQNTLGTTPEGGVLLGPERPRTYEDLSDTEKKRYDADVRAINIVLQGLPKDIYKLINHNIEAKAIWDNVKMLLADDQGDRIKSEIKDLAREWCSSTQAMGAHRIELRMKMQDKMLLMQAQENGAVLDEEELLFLAGEQDNTFDANVDNQPVQDLALNEDNIFQADECDAFDSDLDDEPTAQSIFIANLSSAGLANPQAGLSNASILSKVHILENAIDNSVTNLDEHEIHNEVQQPNVIDSNSVDVGNSNVIPYEQYLSVDNISVVPSCASSALKNCYTHHVPVNVPSSDEELENRQRPTRNKLHVKNE